MEYNDFVELILNEPMPESSDTRICGVFFRAATEQNIEAMKLLWNAHKEILSTIYGKQNIISVTFELASKKNHIAVIDFLSTECRDAVSNHARARALGSACENGCFLTVEKILCYFKNDMPSEDFGYPLLASVKRANRPQGIEIIRLLLRSKELSVESIAESVISVMGGKIACLYPYPFDLSTLSDLQKHVLRMLCPHLQGRLSSQFNTIQKEVISFLIDLGKLYVADGGIGLSPEHRELLGRNLLRQNFLRIAGSTFQNFDLPKDLLSIILEYYNPFEKSISQKELNAVLLPSSSSFHSVEALSSKLGALSLALAPAAIPEGPPVAGAPITSAFKAVREAKQKTDKKPDPKILASKKNKAKAKK